MKRKIRVVKVPESGYIPIGQIGTFHKNQMIEFDDSELDPEETQRLLEGEWIEFVDES